MNKNAAYKGSDRVNRGVTESVKARQGVEARVTLWDDGSVDLNVGNDPRERLPLIALSFTPREAQKLKDWLASDVEELVTR